MKVLVINCGSSSIKYELYEAETGQALAKGIVGCIGEKNSFIRQDTRGREIRRQVSVSNHGESFELIFENLTNRQNGVLRDISEISAVGHRAVHGADTFIESTLINEDVIRKLEECIPLAPLHNPPNLLGIQESRKILPSIPHVAVFDTAFHQTMPPKTYLYPLPGEYYQSFKVRRYGFHGTSCRYVSQKAASALGKPLEELRMIICHLGNGVTVTAVDGGKSLDTSMGLTPLEGPMMGTRSGDIDAGVIFFLHRQVGLSVDHIDNILNRESGLLAVSTVSNNMEEITEEAKKGNEHCQLAMEMFVYRVKKYIGAYAAALEGLESLVFTAGIGENSPIIRAMICEGLEFLGLKLDKAINKDTLGVERIISSSDSRVSIVVVPTNEELMIFYDTLKVAGLNP
ncbi:MAG: acetate kinase [Desulfatiglans sp.]|jgi:acetate kinase|nr:acetate kinase [Desulfatiglans sp.]